MYNLVRKGKKSTVTSKASGVKKGTGSQAPMPSAFQFEGTIIDFGKNMSTSEGKKPPYVYRYVIDRNSHARAWESLGSEDVQLKRWSKRGPTKNVIHLGAQVYGVKKYPKALKDDFKGDEAAMRAYMASIPPAELVPGKARKGTLWRATDYDSELVVGPEGSYPMWRNRFPVTHLINVHGDTWKQTDPNKEQFTAVKVSSIVVDRPLSTIPVHLRMPFDPRTGYLGDLAVPKFLMDEQAHHSFPIGPWISPYSRSVTLEKVLKQYQPAKGVRSVVYQADSVPGMETYVCEKLSDDAEIHGFQTWLQINMLRMEDPKAPEDGSEFDPNMHTKACFSMEVRMGRDVVAPAVGITKLSWFQILMSVHTIPGLVWGRLNYAKTAEANQTSSICTAGEPLAIPMSECNQAKNGHLVAFADAFAPFLAIYLPDNCPRVTREFATKTLPASRDLPNAGPLSGPNTIGISSLREWAHQCDETALNAGSSTPPKGEVHYYALAAKMVENKTADGPGGGLVPERWTMEELENFSRMEPEEGDAFLTEQGKNVVYYVYAVTEAARASTLTDMDARRLGERAWKGDAMAPLYPDQDYMEIEEEEALPQDDKGEEEEEAPEFPATQATMASEEEGDIEEDEKEEEPEVGAKRGRGKKKGDTKAKKSSKKKTKG